MTGAQNVELVADDTISDLCHAHLTGSPPLVAVRGGVIRIRYPRILTSPFRFRAAILRLNSTLPWDIDIRGGAQQVHADLRHTELTRLVVRGGAARVGLQMPPPRGAVSLSFSRGVHRLRIQRPRDTAFRVVVQGGATRAHLDDEVFRAVGGVLEWQTSGYVDAADRYDLTIGGGASGLTVASN